MIQNEIAEIRRQFKQDKSNIAAICGCYVNEKGEILSQFRKPVAIMDEGEYEKFLNLFKKTLSGTVDKNLINIEFSTQQVMESEEHQLLTLLRDTALKDDDVIKKFYEKIIDTVALEENYMVLLAYDMYDVPYRSSDGLEQEDASDRMFTYIMCSICPVKQSKPALGYYVQENDFHSRAIDRIVSPPELGFMFPAFDDRSANIYGALYYCRNSAENHEPFVEAVFNTEIPLPAQTQKEVFQSILSETLADDCNFEVVQAVHGHLQNIMEEHKVNKVETPLTVTKETFRHVFDAKSLPEKAYAAFEQQFENEFGPEADISPQNIVDVKKVELTSQNVKIQVKSEWSSLVETRVIDGVKYILIKAEDGVELNGVPINID